MSLTRPLCVMVFLVLLTAPGLSAQTPPSREHAEPTAVTLTTESDRVRFTTPGAALEWRLEVVDAQNHTVFDSGFVNGKDLDWPLVDAQGQAVESGLYSYTLTIRPRGSEERIQSGQLQIERVRSVYRIAAMNNDPVGAVTLSIIDAAETPAAPSESASRARGSERGWGPASSERSGTTVVATPEMFPRSLSTVSFAPQPLISGSGTTFSMTRWIDGPSGVVGDANVTEQNGSVVVGNGTFKGNLQIFGSATDDVFAGMGLNLITGPGFNYGYAGSTFGRSAGFFNVRPDGSATPPNPSLRFMTANVERMIITNLGKVGIGTTTPGARFEAVTDAGQLEDTLTATRYGSLGPSVFGRRARGTAASPTAVQSGDRLLLVGAKGYDPNGFSGVFNAGIEMFSAEDWTDTSHGTAIQFSTTLIGTTSATERMLINHNGKVGIGTTSVSEQLHVFGNIRVGTASTNGCLQNFAGAALAGTCASDLRFKRDITPFPNLLDRVAQIRPVHYYWRRSEFPQRQFGATQAYGLIAQEVELVLPELVTADEQGYKQVDYSKLPLLMLQAIKELKAENDALQQRLTALEARLTSRGKRAEGRQ